MRAADGPWSAADHETFRVLHAIAAIVDLGRTLDRATIARTPSLGRLIELADSVAEELGWGDTDIDRRFPSPAPQ